MSDSKPIKLGTTRLKEKVYFVRVPEAAYKKIVKLSETEERTIQVVTNRVIRNGLALEHEE